MPGFFSISNCTPPHEFFFPEATIKVYTWIFSEATIKVYTYLCISSEATIKVYTWIFLGFRIAPPPPGSAPVSGSLHINIFLKLFYVSDT